jgi:hypothetical protein
MTNLFFVNVSSDESFKNEETNESRNGSHESSEEREEIQELLSRINDLEHKIKTEKSLSIELEAKLVAFQDENHQLVLEKKQSQSKFKKFNEEMLALKQDVLEVSCGAVKFLCEILWINKKWIFLFFFLKERSSTGRGT